MDALRKLLTACATTSIAAVSIGISASAAAQQAEPSTDALERELAAIEAELAQHYRAELDHAMAERDLHAAGLALRAWRGHHAMSAATIDGALVDDALHARLALHARALAIEGQVPRDLARDVRALDEERARLREMPRRLTRA